MSLRSGQTSFALEDLRLLTALAESGSLAGAARRLHVNHASAWRRLGAMEERLGVRLFDRDRNGYTPTLAGEKAIAAAARMTSELDELERTLAGQDVRPTGTVRLTTTETLLELLAPVAVTLRASHPGIVLEVVTADAFFNLTRRDADIALRPSATAPEHLAARKIARIATAVYAAPAYLRGRSKADPLALDWLAPDDNLAHLGSARWIAAHVPAERIVHRASALPALRAAARAGLGLCALPCYMGDVDPKLVRAMAPLAEMASALWLLTHPDLQRTARVRVVLDAFAEQLVRHRTLLEGERPRG
ncbi:LysR family transcriptional regulator [Pendulispora albinea]|uniref:LysR family transcriptional regulator n=1 Tax=Pendulispora albinea TaxID=2741071 RepID=A0ABZ2M5K4_9BACT